MEDYAGIDVSPEQSSVCVVDAGGKVVREAKVACDPEARCGSALRTDSLSVFSITPLDRQISYRFGRAPVSTVQMLVSSRHAPGPAGGPGRLPPFPVCARTRA